MLKPQQYGTIFGVLVVLLGCGSGEVCRDEISTKGRHFLVSVPPTVDFDEFNCSINIASSGSGHVKVLQHNGHSTTMLGNYSLLRGEVENLYISGQSIHQTHVGKQTKVIEIISTVDVAVYVTGYLLNVAASFVAFPVEALSVEYSIPTYKAISVFSSSYNYLLITSLDNVTNINISNYDSYKSSYHETISRLESYTLKTLEDTQIATLYSSKPVNVVVGSTCTTVPIHIGNCDTMYDSPIPVKFWGSTFIVPPLKPKNGYSIRLYPRTETTTVNVEYYNKTARRNITFKGMKELLMGTDPAVILSDQPINVVQYGFTEFGEGGDAFMTSVPAVTHFSNDYVFTTPFPYERFTYRLAVTIERGHLNGLLLNGKNVSTLQFLGKWTPNSPFDTYTVITLEIQQGVHVLQHQSKHVKFAALLYGLKQYYAFGHNLGFSFPVEKKHICQNGGSCMRDGKCSCLSGFTGDSCEHSLPPRESRGPLCLDCENVRNPKECDQITLCSSDEMCRIEELPSGDNSLFHLGCKATHECATESRSSRIGTASRSVPKCVACCHDDFCNTNCTRQDHSQEPIIVG